MKMIRDYQRTMGVTDLLADNPKVITETIIRYLIKLKERGSSPQTRKVAVAAILRFYDINDVTLNRKKITSFIGEFKRTVKDRPYTHEEIRKLLDKSDERKRVVILILASTGIRVGALPDMKVRHLKRIDSLYQFTVYESTESEYTTFCTPECARAIDSYLDFRRRYGERITHDSYLIREQFDKDIHAKPRPLSTNWFYTMISELMIDAGIRERPTEKKVKRYEIMAVHAFRKFFDTNLTKATKNPLLTEILLGHNIGLKGSYYKPSNEDLLQAYLLGVDALTINEENRLKHKVQTLSAENDVLKKQSEKIEQIWKHLGMKP